MKTLLIFSATAVLTGCANVSPEQLEKAMAGWQQYQAGQQNMYMQQRQMMPRSVNCTSSRNPDGSVGTRCY